MAKSARQTVFEGMELLPDALIPFVEKRLESTVKGHWQTQATEQVNGLRIASGVIDWDQAGLLKAVMAFWKTAFAPVLGPTERSIVSELLEARNRLSHNDAFSYDDAERALDSMRRLCDSIGAGEATAELRRMRDAILRTKYQEQLRNEERKSARPAAFAFDARAGLTPWREVATPHRDVRDGDFVQAEFAANLADVDKPDTPSEYGDPTEFFARTHLTGGLCDLLTNAAKRLSDAGGDPVVQLQTGFGGGKTHSMLALHHMAGETAAAHLPGLDQLLAKSGLTVPVGVARAVLVGTARGPMNPLPMDDGRKANTTWGELAWRLGGRDAFDTLAENDAQGIAPGSDLLREIFAKSAPNLILIDEWVAYLRQIYGVDGLPSGSFDANLSFVQALTEAVKTSPQTLLVASLPESEIEVGGEGGKEALARLQRTFGRVETSWRPASREESYEIVRRRLFDDIPGDKYMHRDNTVKQFAKLYRENPNDFPKGCADADYRNRLERAYPIHPDLFDHLYTAWGALEAFQRTRGVLRLMAQAIHELWMSDDSSAAIMPGGIAVGSERVGPEFRRYLPDAWQAIVAGDVDGDESEPYRIEESAPTLGRIHAARRVARAVFLATAPTEGRRNRGIDARRINLGVVQPGERTAIFGDALRRLTERAKFMHGARDRHWYSTDANLNRMAADRAGQFEEALVRIEIDKALDRYVKRLARGNFDAVHVAPGGSADVPDEPGGVRAIVLGTAHPHTTRNGVSAALDAANDILRQRGATPRVYRNTLVFLAADDRRLADLQAAMRASLAWNDIVKGAETGNPDLKDSEKKHAWTKANESDATLRARLGETWRHLLWPHQENAQSDTGFETAGISAQSDILNRACKKLVDDEALLPEIGPERLNRALKDVWNGNPHLSLKDLWDYLNRYTYLPRLVNRRSLIAAVRAAVGGADPGPFAYAERWDAESQTYAGLVIERASSNVPVVIDGESVIVRREVAEANRPAPGPMDSSGKAPIPPGPTPPNPPPNPDPSPAPAPTRFSGTVELSPDRPSHDMHRVVEGVIEQLTALPKAEVTLTLEIDAEVPSGLDRAKVRTLMENAATLGFTGKKISE